MATLHYRCTPSEQRPREKNRGKAHNTIIGLLCSPRLKGSHRETQTYPSLLEPLREELGVEKLQNAKPFHHRHLFWYDDEWSRSRGPPWSDPSTRPRKREGFRFYRFWVSSSFPSTYSHIPADSKSGGNFYRCWAKNNYNVGDMVQAWAKM